MRRVRPGVELVRASPFRPTSRLIRVDLPTFERPSTATPGKPSVGKTLASAASAVSSACRIRPRLSIDLVGPQLYPAAGLDGENGADAVTKGVQIALAALSSETSQAARVHGFVVAGSIAKNLPAGHVDFSVEDKGKSHTLSVRYLGIDVPDMFKDGAEVVVEGRFESGRFLAE